MAGISLTARVEPGLPHARVKRTGAPREPPDAMGTGRGDINGSAFMISLSGGVNEGLTGTGDVARLKMEHAACGPG
jgi:hypothetical protein